MTKIQMFAGDNGMTLQAEVNAFIADKKVIDIKLQSQIYPTEFTSNGTPCRFSANDRILVIYEEEG